MEEIIFYNGNILTMEDNQQVEAVYVKDGKILYAGNKEDVFAHKTAATQMRDLEGKTLMPSFIDSHSHLSTVASSLSLAALSGVESYDQLIQVLKEYKEKNHLKPGDWLVGFGYDHNSLAEKKHPTADVLDQVSTENPVIIAHASGHMGAVNHLALKLLGITAQSSDPVGGVIGRQPGSQEPNGYLEENAFIQISAKMPRPSAEVQCQMLLRAAKVYESYGITTIQDGMTGRGEMELFKALSQSGKLDSDVVLYIDMNQCQDLLESNASFVEQYQGRVKIGGYKIFLDGSPQGRTAWLSKPYLNGKPGEEEYCGYPIHSDEKIESFCRTALEEKHQLLAHCNGDAASEQLLKGFEHVLGKGGHCEIRPVMVHAQTARHDQLDRMKTIGMIPSFFVAHTYFWGDVHRENLGDERAEHISPAGYAMKIGLPFTFHQDTPVLPCDMITTIWCAVNRISKQGVSMGEDEKIPVEEALKAVTLYAAYQYFEEDRKGSIRPGKLADFVILDQNPLTIEPMKLREIQVLETIKEGKTIYQKA